MEEEEKKIYRVETQRGKEGIIQGAANKCFKGKVHGYYILK